MWSSLRSRAARLLPSAMPSAPTSSGPLATFVRTLKGTKWGGTTGYVTMKRRFKGLYGGKHIQFGNNVSFSHRVTRRTFKPNVQQKRFYSELLSRFLQFRMTASVIKDVKRLAGGIDQYLLTTPNELLLYPTAIKIKRNLRSLLRIRARDHAIASSSELGGAEAASVELPYHVPGLWAHEIEKNLTKPRIYGKHFNAKHWEKKPTMGHASWR